MLMRGDMQKIIDQVNPVFETAFNRLEALAARVETLEKQISEGDKPKRGPGRPPKEKK